MPNGIAGSAGQVLVSQGENAAPVWQTFDTGDKDWLVAKNNQGQGGSGAFNQVPTNLDQWIYTNGRVGIGTSEPGQTLDVVGRLRFRADGGSGDSSTPGFWLTDNSGTENVFTGLQGTTATSSWGVWSNGAWRFTITNSGNVGIGTTTPGNFNYSHNILLHVHSPTNLTQIATSGVFFGGQVSAPNFGVMSGGDALPEKHGGLSAVTRPTCLISFPESEGPYRQIIFRVNGNNSMAILGEGRVQVGALPSLFFYLDKQESFWSSNGFASS